MDVERIIDRKSEHWKKKLIDLSRKNNLVSYRLAKARSLRIKKPGFLQIAKDLNDGKKIGILKKEEAKGRNLWFCGEEESSVDKKLSNLHFKTKENFQELGLNTCFVSIGVLKYSEPDESEFLKAPILLFPVALNRRLSTSKERHRFEITSRSEDVKVNPALVEKLLNDFQIHLPEFKEQSIQEYLDQAKDALSERDGWSVGEDVFLDVFSYQKYIMYEDLSSHKKLLKESPLVRAFVGDREAFQVDEFQKNDFDDAQSVDVLPADSSQKQAIELAKLGVSFVLQGPPGTGKSQTISNMIAELIKQKKKVLFVSQKMAALNIVHRNLSEIGLSRYCLNLHNYRGNKKEIVTQLITELETSPVIKESAKQYSFARYVDAQRSLNKFYQVLCEKREPRNVSIYDVRGELAGLSEVDVVYERLPESLLLDEEQFSRLFSVLENLDQTLAKVPSPKDNFYFSFESSKNKIFERDRFKSELIKNWSLLNELVDLIDFLNDEANVKIETIQELEKFCKKHHEARHLLKGAPEFFLTEDVQEVEEVISELFGNLSELRKAEKKVLEGAGRKFLRGKTQSQERILRRTSFLGKAFRKEYGDAIRELESLSGRKMSRSSWLGLFEQKKKYEKALSDHELIKKKNDKILSHLESPDSIEVVEKFRNKAKNFLAAYDLAASVKPTGIDVVKFWVNEESKLGCLQEFLSNLKELDGFFARKKFRRPSEINDLKNELRGLLDGLSQIDDVLDFKREYNSLPKEVRNFVDKHLEQNPVSKLSLTFLKSYYLQLLDEFSEQGIDHAQTRVEQFRELDHEAREAKRFKVMDLIEKEKSEFGFRNYERDEISVLRRESEKKRNLKPIRVLLEEISNVVFKLKPCFMMSPLSVSQYINPKTTQFDVVIFDEASQIMPEDAVPCLIRAQQAIVVGDTQQLPPTSFFMSDRDVFFDQEGAEDLESFLSECSTRFASKPLLWHYRSRNEPLIAFSNSFFYKNRLVTFPSSRIKDDSALEFNYVKNGVYDRGKSRSNRIEARELVKRYKEIRKESPEMSVGIVAFSIAQENAIRDEFMADGLNFEESMDPSAEDSFIKNVETVQGDERDVILISLGYGKDSAGRFSYNFGPLNSQGGSKRLNVAITRSRFKTIIFSSILPEGLDSRKINSEGIKLLKYYLEYAKNKNFSKFLPDSGSGFDSSFEKSVYEALTNEGFSVSSQVGSSKYKIDLAIRHPFKPGEYVLGIECDGSQYHVSKLARDRDRTRPEILRNLGWNLHRIWSENWLENRELELKKIKEKIDVLLNSEGKHIKPLKFELRQELRVKDT